MKTQLAMMVIAVGFMVSGCAELEEKYDVGEYTAVSNPASVYCVEQNGELVIQSEAGKRVTYCKQEDGQMTEQWQYYRQGQEQEN
ncbi:putative hemolysin [Vibrio sp. WXL103]|uniref:putative hemolysin n=1 Tax=unclassified Vibrio TaxID=2614977 RepID=UPI003EC5376A